MGPVSTRNNWPAFTDHGETEGVTEAEQGKPVEYGAQTLQRVRRSGERYHRRFPPQSQEPKACKNWQCSKSRGQYTRPRQVTGNGSRSGSFHQNTRIKTEFMEECFAEVVGILQKLALPTNLS